MMPAGSPSKPRRGYRRHGFHSAEAALTKGGVSALDGRSVIARAVREWRAAVAADLGGPEVLSETQRTRLEVAAQDVVLLSVADAWLRENAPGIINRRRRAFWWSNASAWRPTWPTCSKTLGLERKARPVPTLSEYVAEKGKAS